MKNAAAIMMTRQEMMVVLEALACASRDEMISPLDKQVGVWMGSRILDALDACIHAEA